jgi:hypothetical protein
VKRASWVNGYVNLFHLNYPSKRPWSKDVNLNMPHMYRAFTGHLSIKILQLLLIAQFLQHFPDHSRYPSNLISMIAKLVSILVLGIDLWLSWFLFWLYLRSNCNRDLYNREWGRKVTTNLMANDLCVNHLQNFGKISKVSKTIFQRRRAK